MGRALLCADRDLFPGCPANCETNGGTTSSNPSCSSGKSNELPPEQVRSRRISRLSAIGISRRLRGEHKSANIYDLIVLGGAAIAALLAISATIYVCYRFAELIVATLGERGTTVMVRLSAFVLLCIGIEIVWSGYSALVGTGR